jgi:hypothetical protein
MQERNIKLEEIRRKEMEMEKIRKEKLNINQKLKTRRK